MVARYRLAIAVAFASLASIVVTVLWPEARPESGPPPEAGLPHPHALSGFRSVVRPDLRIDGATWVRHLWKGYQLPERFSVEHHDASHLEFALSSSSRSVWFELHRTPQGLDLSVHGWTEACLSSGPVEFEAGWVEIGSADWADASALPFRVSVRDDQGSGFYAGGVLEL